MHIYKILGFLNNYAGGLNLANSIVQTFYIENDLTNIVVEELKKECIEFFAERNVVSDLTVEKIDTNFCKVKSQFICAEIVKIINPIEHWGKDYIFFNEELFDKVEFLKQRDEDERGNKQKLAFLQTALIRHKVDNKYVFYNEYDKAILIHKILSTFYTDDCILKMQSYFNIPNVIEIEVIKSVG